MLTRFYLFFFVLLFPLASDANDIAAVQAAAKQNYFVSPNSVLGRDLVTWYRLRQSENVEFREARDFVHNHPNWPDLFTIRKNAEASMQNGLNPNEIIHWFQKHEPATAKGMEIYLSTLISTRRTADAMQILKAWWPKALLTPEETIQFHNKVRAFFRIPRS